MLSAVVSNPSTCSLAPDSNAAGRSSPVLTSSPVGPSLPWPALRSPMASPYLYSTPIAEQTLRQGTPMASGAAGRVGCAAPVRNSLSIQTFRAERSILMRLAAICAAILTLAASGALAQESPTSQSPASRQPSTVGNAWQAPVGHRQPKLSDLPPDLARQEDQFAEPPKFAEPSRAGQDRNIDPQLKICRGC
jgi:hypothetical protein